MAGDPRRSRKIGLGDDCNSGLTFDNWAEPSGYVFLAVIFQLVLDLLGGDAYIQ
jgi:hypothetical protein